MGSIHTYRSDAGSVDMHTQRSTDLESVRTNEIRANKSTDVMHTHRSTDSISSGRNINSARKSVNFSNNVDEASSSAQKTEIQHSEDSPYYMEHTPHKFEIGEIRIPFRSSAITDPPQFKAIAGSDSTIEEGTEKGEVVEK